MRPFEDAYNIARRAERKISLARRETIDARSIRPRISDQALPFLDRKGNKVSSKKEKKKRKEKKEVKSLKKEKGKKKERKIEKWQSWMARGWNIYVAGSGDFGPIYL